MATCGTLWLSLFTIERKQSFGLQQKSGHFKCLKCRLSSYLKNSVRTIGHNIAIFNAIELTQLTVRTHLKFERLFHRCLGWGPSPRKCSFHLSPSLQEQELTHLFKAEGRISGCYDKAKVIQRTGKVCSVEQHPWSSCKLQWANLQGLVIWNGIVTTDVSYPLDLTDSDMDMCCHLVIPHFTGQ